MLYDGRVLFDGSVEQIRNSPDPIVRHFVEGRAHPEELRALGNVDEAPAGEEKRAEVSGP